MLMFMLWTYDYMIYFQSTSTCIEVPICVYLHTHILTFFTILKAICITTQLVFRSGSVTALQFNLVMNE